MNKIIKSILKKATALSLVVMLGACDYLDIVPDNVATIDYAFRSRETALQFVLTCYRYRPEIGDIDWDPAMSGGDEIWQFRPVTANFRTFYGQQIARSTQNAASVVMNFWDGYNNTTINNLWIGIRDCNIFLERFSDPAVLEVMEQSVWEQQRWISEVKFMKAYYHWYLLRMYGPIPIVDKNLEPSASVEEVKVSRRPLDEVVEYIIALINEALPGLPTQSQVVPGSEAGRVDKLAALATIADIRLWAASPLVNKNANIYSSIKNRDGTALFPTSYDPEKWKLAAEAAEAAITEAYVEGRSMYKVIPPITTPEDPFFQQQCMLRQIIGDRWNSELIWGGTSFNCPEITNKTTPRMGRFTADLNSLSGEWAPTIKMVDMFYSKNGVPIEQDKDWSTNGWYDDRYKIRETPATHDERFMVKEGEITVNLHYNREPRFYADLGFDRGIYYGSGNYKFEGEGANVKYVQALNFEMAGYQGGAGYSCTGYFAKKMNAFQCAPDWNTGYPDPQFYPFPIYRLADLFLMYAEATNEYEGYNGPNSDKMYGYIDSIRFRAGLEGVKDSWRKYATNPDFPNSTEGMREIIQRERTIELMFEGKRFWDIRRWGQISTLNIQPQGWNFYGETREDYYKLINVNPTTVEFSSKDYFWPIQESALNVNSNLVQNYGW